MSGAEEPAPPSSFFVEELDSLHRAALLGPVVDLACGRGRHALAAARAGVRTIGLDRNASFLAGLGDIAKEHELPLSGVRFDLEAGPAPPFRQASCGAILIFRFLYRPLAAQIASLLAPGGLLLYETFTRAQLELSGGPRNPRFLLEPGELRELFADLEVLSYAEGLHDGAATARLTARKPPGPLTRRDD